MTPVYPIEKALGAQAMAIKPRQPQPDDAVLGGQSLAPLDGAVLGGIEGVKQRFELGDIEQKKQALDQALQYGDRGLDFLFNLLDQESNYDVHLKIYHLLIHTVQRQKDDNFFNSFLKSLKKTGRSSKSLSKARVEQIKLYLEKYKNVIETENLIQDAEKEVKELNNDEQQKLFSRETSELIHLYSSCIESTRRADKVKKEAMEYKKKCEEEIQRIKAEKDKLVQSLLDEFGLES